MNQARTDKQLQDLWDRVQRRLDAYCRDRDFGLKVRDAVAEVDDWVHFIVTPDKEGVRAYDYVEALSDVEDELHRDEGEKHVKLVPAVPD